MAPIPLASLPASEVPEELRVASYFDLDARPFAHRALFEGAAVNSVVAAVARISDYAREAAAARIAKARAERGAALRTLAAAPEGGAAVGAFALLLDEGALCRPAWIRGAAGKERPGTLFLGRSALLFGSTIHLNEGDVVIGEGTVVEPGVTIKGPTIIGDSCEIRGGAYLRGNLVIGNRAVLRGELKNAVLMDRTNFPHPSYVGDSILGFGSHFGNQATAANLGIFEGLRGAAERAPVLLRIGGKSYDTGRSKLGVILGDFCQVGCNSVTDPGTFLRPYTIAYALTRIPKGFYGPRVVLKNKPLEKGVIEIAPFASA